MSAADGNRGSGSNTGGTTSGRQSAPRGPLGYTSSFYSETQAVFRNRQAPRFLAAVAVALIALLVFIWLGPPREEIQRRFEIYGAEGQLNIMPELSIDDGADAVHQLPRIFEETPPATAIEIIPENTDPDAQEETPAVREEVDVVNDVVTDKPVTEASDESVNQAEMTLPRQSNPDFIIVKMVRPLYPHGVSEAERRISIVQVDVAIFVDPTGEVAASMITATNGGELFTQAVLQAMDQWEFKWTNDEAQRGSGRWLELTWRFRSPYDLLDGG